MASNYILSMAHSHAEVLEFQRFLKTNPKPTLPIPQLEELFRSRENGGLYTVRDEHGLIACGGAFPYQRDASAEVAVVRDLYELAAARVTLGGLRPYKLQELLVWLRIAGVAWPLAEDGPKLCFLSSVFAQNEPSITSLRSAGMVELGSPVPQWLAEEDDLWCQGKPVVHFTLPPRGLRTIAARLLAVTASGFEFERDDRDNPPATIKIRLRFDIGWLQYARPILVEMAAGKYDHIIAELPNDAEL